MKSLLRDKENKIDLDDFITQLNSLERTMLVNDDPVTCCIYFYKLVNCFMTLISNPKNSKNPFGKYRVFDYFIRFEFQHRGSPHCHMLLWVENDPHEFVSEDMPLTIELINTLCSVSFESLPESYKIGLGPSQKVILDPNDFDQDFYRKHEPKPNLNISPLNSNPTNPSTSEIKQKKNKICS